MAPALLVWLYLSGALLALGVATESPSDGAVRLNSDPAPWFALIPRILLWPLAPLVALAGMLLFRRRR